MERSPASEDEKNISIYIKWVMTSWKDSRGFDPKYIYFRLDESDSLHNYASEDIEKMRNISLSDYQVPGA